MKPFRSIALAPLALLLMASLAQATTLINGAGATFPYPLYSKWFSDYRKVDPSVEINYQSIGSGGGITQLLAKKVDFGASDAPMTDQELAQSQIPILHIPTVLGAVVLTYNLPGIEKPLRLSPEVIAEIFMGTITKWDDAKIAKINPGVALPKDLALVAAYRSDGSGTTAIFTDYLAKVSPQFKEKVGAGKAVKWPVGLGGKGNEGVTGTVKQTPGAIGYVELIYAKKNNLSIAEVKNKAGKWVMPELKSVTAAAAGAMKTMPADFRVSITDADGAGAYPISGFTYLLIYQKMDADKGTKLVKFLNWALTEGQKIDPALSYAPLPSALVKKVQAKVKEIKTE